MTFCSGPKRLVVSYGCGRRGWEQGVAGPGEHVPLKSRSPEPPSTPPSCPSDQHGLRHCRRRHGDLILLQCPGIPVQVGPRRQPLSSRASPEVVIWAGWLGLTVQILQPSLRPWPCLSLCPCIQQTGTLQTHPPPHLPMGPSHPGPQPAPLGSRPLTCLSCQPGARGHRVRRGAAAPGGGGAEGPPGDPWHTPGQVSAQGER